MTPEQYNQLQQAKIITPFIITVAEHHLHRIMQELGSEADA